MKARHHDDHHDHDSSDASGRRRRGAATASPAIHSTGPPSDAKSESEGCGAAGNQARAGSHQVECGRFWAKEAIRGSVGAMDVNDDVCFDVPLDEGSGEPIRLSCEFFLIAA